MVPVSPEEHPDGATIGIGSDPRGASRADGRTGARDTAAPRSDLVRLAVRPIVEAALDAEGTDALDREPDERVAGGGEGYRNGHRRGMVKTAAGAVDDAAPQLRKTPELFV